LALPFFPIEEKISPSTAQMRTSKICEIVQVHFFFGVENFVYFVKWFQVLIINALTVGILPESIIERLGSHSSVDLKKEKASQWITNK
jgi:hypothetical protein